MSVNPAVLVLALKLLVFFSSLAPLNPDVEPPQLAVVEGRRAEWML